MKGYYNTLHYNTLQHTAIKSIGFNQHNAIHCNTPQNTVAHCNTLQHTPIKNFSFNQKRWALSAKVTSSTHCNTLQHTMQHTSIKNIGLSLQRWLQQHTATHCNTLYNILLSKTLGSLQRWHQPRPLTEEHWLHIFSTIRMSDAVCWSHSTIRSIIATKTLVKLWDQNTI